MDEHGAGDFAEPNPASGYGRPASLWSASSCFLCGGVEQTVKELAEVGIECEPIREDDFTGKKMTFLWPGRTAAGAA